MFMCLFMNSSIPSISFLYRIIFLVHADGLYKKIIKKINNQIRYRNIFNVIKCKTNITSLSDQLKNNRKIVERGKIDTLSTRIHGHLHCWLGTGTSINKVAGLS